jgi:3-oxoadipate enol-lactonase
MPFANLEDISLYYEEVDCEEAGREAAGAADHREPLLLIAGQSSDHRSWDGVRDDFAREYRVIVYDHRGTGQSDKPEKPPYSTRGFASDVIGLLDHLGIARAHAYGISMGGRICQWLGIDYPDRLGGLVLGCTTPGNAHGVARDPEISSRMADPTLSVAERIDLSLPLMVSPGWSAAHPEYRARLLAEQATSPMPDYARRLHFDASEGHDSWEGLPAIKAPTLIIHGTEDYQNPTANAQLLVNRIPGAELCLVPGGRHLYFIEKREEASRAVLDFLRRHPLG